MSEVKLYVLGDGHLCNTEQTNTGIQWKMHLYQPRPATADEIKAAHPKCITCRYCLTTRHGMGEGECGHCEESVTTWYCMEPGEDHYITEPTKDYCRHHTPKEAL